VACSDAQEARQVLGTYCVQRFYALRTTAMHSQGILNAHVDGFVPKKSNSARGSGDEHIVVINDIDRDASPWLK